MPIVILVLIAASLVLAGWAGWRAARNSPVILRQLIAAGAIEAGIVMQMIVAAVWIARGNEVDPVLFWGYLVTALLVFPAAAVVAVVERTRWSSVVLVAACVTVVVMQVRVHQLWSVGIV
ncbi:hypothetical protein [Ruania halotolerans]|uniref:hypothetical protein n=1 Tax=Ruania halotolerans TaxID=2897773 RepID=UPI001E446976|nr:hypothetical protein [Ruania halotolerans]UFU04846.1 hypothetical protein LQF10_10140 [Ruania halotolerans]